MTGSFIGKLPERTIFARESFTSELFSEALPLLAAHWQEIAHYPDIPLNPDLSFYHSCEKAGILRCFTARRESTLVGYAVFIARYNPHYRTSFQASQDVIYIAPDSRGKMGLKFIRFCDRELQQEHVQAVYHHVKAAHNFGLLLQRIGYELVDLIYARRLDKEE